MKPAASRKNIAAIPTSPMPRASPMTMAVKIAAISLAVPGTLRNRTSVNAPATATPVPTFPFTSMMTRQTTMGSMARASAKLALCLLLYKNTSAVSTPKAMAAAIQTRNTGRVIGFVKTLFIISFSSFLKLSGGDVPPVTGSIF